MLDAAVIFTLHQPDRMPRHPDPLDVPADPSDAPSKTRVKKAMLELQDLGAAMLQLPDATLNRLQMDDRLRDALRELRRLKSHGARSRQLQYVGKLMRNEDAEPYRRALTEWQLGRVRDLRALKDIEVWRERLLEGQQGLDAWIAEHPACDTKAFRTLVLNARRERDQARALAERTHREPANGPFYRALFKELRGLLLSPAA